MTVPPGCWVVVPAYNEAQTIGSVVQSVVDAGFAVVVVDDGSADDTAEQAAAHGARVVVHPFNLGQGAGLQTGIEFALAQRVDYIVTFDADGQHRVADLDVVLAPLVEGRADFALGSRFLGGTVGAPASRRLLLKAATLFTRAFGGLALTDAHNGLRGMTRRGAGMIHLRQNRMAHASEITAEMARSGLPIVEVPVTIHYSEYSLGKGQSMFDAFIIVMDLVGRALRR